jgi:hypothetical protein
MSIKVDTGELLEAAARIREIGRRVTSYGDRMDGRVTRVAHGVDDDIAASLRQAWAEVDGAIGRLAEGFQTYGEALADVADRYAELESLIAVRGRR